jgi:hypothetical protein
MRNTVLVLGSVFAIALAAVVGNRLSNDAMAVVVGAFCGLVASVPFTIALVIALKQNWGQAPAPRDEYGGYSRQPPVVVIAPPQQMAAPYASGSSPLYLPPNVPAPGAPREFKIIGEE